MTGQLFGGGLGQDCYDPEETHNQCVVLLQVRMDYDKYMCCFAFLSKHLMND